MVSALTINLSDPWIESFWLFFLTIEFNGFIDNLLWKNSIDMVTQVTIPFLSKIPSLSYILLFMMFISDRNVYEIIDG